MKKILISIALLLALSFLSFAQPTGYYNGIEGKTGEELKTALHNIIKGHIEYSYSAVKDILKQSDEDPANSSNIILVYTGRSLDKASFASNNEPDNWNREHIWAKSHGGFGTDRGAGTDAHHLKPVDASVNSARSYKDFDNGGTPHSEATGCNTDNDSWEPRDEVKGDVARMILYMAVRYEGTDGELDLEAVDQVSTFPNPKHGKLSVLLEWNEQDPPDAFERHRNQVIFEWQKNRNPFIDNPELVNLIWGENPTANAISIGNITINNPITFINETRTISADITSSKAITSAKVLWGTSYDELTNSVDMTATSNNYSAEIPAQTAAATIYYKVEAKDGTNTNSIKGNFKVQNTFTGTLKTIKEVQGEVAASPLINQTVSMTGIVTAFIGKGFYIQDAVGAWNGIYVYDFNNHPSLGDSVIVTGTVVEYHEFTEIKDAEMYVIAHNKPVPAPVEVASGELANEQYEGVYVKVKDATCKNADAGYGMWTINDGSGECHVHNSYTYEYEPNVNAIYTVQGVLAYDFEKFKIELRKEGDVIDGEDSEVPTLKSVTVINETTLYVTFSEVLDQNTAINANNYSINNDINVLGASFGDFENKVVKLMVENLKNGTHTLTVNGVTDPTGNVMTNATMDFEVTGDATEDLALKQIKVYPNPATNNTVFVQQKGNKELSISIFDTKGQKVFSNTYNKQNIEINHKLSSGIYFIQLKSGNEISTQKLIIE